MRLGQLARKLALRPIEIVDFLAAQKIQIEEGSNTRIEDEHVTRIMKHYAPDMVKEVEEELAVEHESNEPKIQSAVEKNEIIQDGVPSENSVDEFIAVENSKIEEHVDTFILTDQCSENEPDIIRAPKIELPGLKVLGKIDIPDPKKKETPFKEDLPIQETPILESVDKPALESRRPPQKRRGRDERPQRNPIAIQREREAMEEEQKRRDQAKREKEKRTQNYLKKVKTSQPMKAARLVNEQLVEMSDELNDIPKTWWGRLKKWLTS